MATIDDVYRMFGEAAEAAQLLETELGTMLFALNAAAENLFEFRNPAHLAELLEGVNRHTLGQLLKRLGKTTDFLEALESQLIEAREERNRLSHAFYRQHNLRRNSAQGRELMLEDLRSIHGILFDAYKAVMLLTGADLDALAAATTEVSPEQPASVELPARHLPI